MIDGIPRGNGNGYLLKGGSNFPATYEELLAAIKAGTLPVDINFNAAGWAVIGTLLSKATMLSDATAALLGNVNTVDAALALLGRFNGGLGNDYLWRRGKYVTEYAISSADGASHFYSSSYTGNTYGKSISINKDTGEITIGDTFTPASPPTTANSAYWTSLLPFYAYTAVDPNFPAQVGYHYATSISATTDYNLYCSGTKLTAVSATVFTDISYLNSPDSAAYPPSESDGYTYTALGQLGSKVQIATGSYTGTGTYGSSNPNSLTFEFAPKFILVNNTYTSTFLVASLFGSDYSVHGMTQASGTTAFMYTKVSGNAAYWYSDTSADRQQNTSGKIYAYVAIG